MKFNATTWIDRNYKKISGFAVIVVSLLAILYYCNTLDKSDMFIPSTLYALFLFVIGIFNSGRSAKIDSLFLDRVDIYLNLNRAKELFRSLSFSEEYQKTKDNIFWFQAFSGRLTIEGAPKINYIKEKGFSFDINSLESEKEYCELYDKLIIPFQNEISIFIKNNSIELRKNNLSIDESIFFTPEIWINNTFIITNDNKILVFNFINKKILDFKNGLTKLTKLKRKIDKLYNGFKNNIDKNILFIKNVYGVKLVSHIKEDNGRRADMDYFLEQMEAIKNEIIEYVEHNDDKLDTCSDKLDDVTADLNNIYNLLAE